MENNKITAGDMFSGKKGMKIRLTDGKVIVLTSDYLPEGLEYTYDRLEEIDGVETVTESGTISCMLIRGGEII